MLKSHFISSILAGFLLFPGWAPSSVADEATGADNIGFVIYTRSFAPGTLNARWMFTDKYKGSGIATGGPGEGYAGRYHVRYFYDGGEFSDEYDLTIEKHGDVYKASWSVDGKIRAVGIGMDVGNGLAVGWRRVTE